MDTRVSHLAAPTQLGDNIAALPKESISQIEFFVRQIVKSLLSKSTESGIIPKKTEFYTGPKHLGELDNLIKVSLGYIEEIWTDTLAAQGVTFEAPKVVLYHGSTKIGEHTHTRDMGPCYDPNSQTIYLDPLFFETFRLEVYSGCEDATILMVLAHEMAHYIQDIYFSETVVEYEHEGKKHTRTLYYILDLIDFTLYHHFDSHHQASQIVELHADFLTGVCLRLIHQKYPHLFHHDDFHEVVHAKSLIGDDMLQMLAGKKLTPESYMHGRFDQRVLALYHGFTIGDPFHFSIQKIVEIFFKKGDLQPTHVTVEMFENSFVK